MESRIALALAFSFLFMLQSSALRDQELLGKYTAPSHIVDILRAHTPFLQTIVNNCAQEKYRKRRKHLVWRLDDLPHYYIKWDVGRIKGLEIMSACIEKHDLTHLSVPKKYLYHIPGTPETLDNSNYVVIAEEQKPCGIPLVITEEEAQDITTLISQTGYYEFTEKNIIRTAPDTITLIDTECRLKKPSFGLYKLLSRHGLFDLNAHFTQAALKHIFHHYLQSVLVDASSYKERYEQILKNIIHQSNDAQWDYVSFFRQTFPEPAE